MKHFAHQGTEAFAGVRHAAVVKAPVFGCLLFGLFVVFASPLARAVVPMKKAPCTKVSIVKDKWNINNRRSYPGALAERLLMNVRIVNTVFEDTNEQTRPKGFDADATRTGSLRAFRIA